MRKARVIFCLFLMAVAAYAIRSAMQWNFKAALFPLAISLPLLTLVGIHLMQVMAAKEDLDQEAIVDLDFSGDVPPELARRRVVLTFCWIVGFIASVSLMGFPLTVPLFIFAYLKFQSKVSWLYTMAATALTWGGFYALFQRLVHIQFEAGIIQTWLGL